MSFSSPVSLTLSYPPIHRDPSIIDSLHGHIIPDPYRWLEDPDSADTTAFVDAQVNLTNNYFDLVSDKLKFHDKLTQFFNYERFSAPSLHGDYYYSWYNSGLLNQSILNRQRSLISQPEIFFDPNSLSEDGTVALTTCAFSELATYFAYALSASGSDWVTIRVKRVQDLSDLDDVIQFAKFTSINWTKDELGFFYTRYPKVDKSGDVDLGTETDVNLNAKVYYHKLGTSQSDDILVWEDKDHPKFRGGITESYCGKYLILSITESTAPKNKLWIALRPVNGDYSITNLNWIKLDDQIDHAGYDYLTNFNTVFYFQTNLNAPRYRIVKYDLNNSDAGFVDVISEDPIAPLKFATSFAGDKAMLVYSRDVIDIVYLYDLPTGQRLQEIQLPVVGSVTQLSAKRKYDEAFFAFSGFTTPGTIMRFDVNSRLPTVFKQSTVNGYDPDQFEAHQEFYHSKDGTRIPMFIIHRKGITLDGSHPTFLYGYGGFSIPIQPSFSPSYTAFMKHYGTVIAIANLRGGGEYGEDWHWDGALLKKQNVFDDFQFAAKHLVSRGYTSHEKLAINGGSNGGLLVGACINQAPELFAAAVAQVGVMDMLRFHKFTIGHAWIADFGDPDKKEDFENILKYSPLHNVKKQKYPATLLMTSDHDDRVVPLHSYKFIAELQYQNPNNPNPLLIQIERKAGHGAGKPTTKRIESDVWKYLFIAKNIGAEWRD